MILAIRRAFEIAAHLIEMERSPTPYERQESVVPLVIEANIF
jgi:hypothetical protein